MNKTPEMTHAEAVLEASRLLTKLRARPVTEEDIVADLTGLATGEPTWRSDLLALLAEANGIPLHILIGTLGIGPAVVMARRRKDKTLDSAIQNYLGAYFEDEASLPTRGVAAGVLLAGLERHAHNWKPDEGRNLSDEDLQKLIRAIIDSVRLRVKDQTILKAIGADIAETLKRVQA